MNLLSTYFLIATIFVLTVEHKSLQHQLESKTQLSLCEIVWISFLNSSNNTQFIYQKQKQYQNGQPTIILTYTQSTTKLFAKTAKYFFSFRHKGIICSIVNYLQIYDSFSIAGHTADKIFPGGTFATLHVFSKLQCESANFDISELYYVWCSSDGNSALNEKQNFTSLQANGQFKTLLMTLVASQGPQSIKYFQKTGKWDLEAVGYAYYAALRLNASLDFVNVRAPPGRGPRNNPNYKDPYVDPLLNGKVHITSKIFDPSMIKYGIVFLSRTAFYDRITFLSPLPKKLVSKNIWTKLTDPFTLHVWIFIFACIGGIVLILIISFFLFQTNSSRFSVLGSSLENTFVAITRTLFEQADVEFNLSRNVRQNSVAWKIILLWGFMASVILSNLYKSVFVSEMVKPDISFVPKDLKELVNSPDWGINALLFEKSVKVLFEEINQPTTMNLVRRAKSIPWSKGVEECFYLLLTTKSVCLGHDFPLTMFRDEHLTDSSGELMCVVSKDGIFSAFSPMGVSRKYPEVLQSLNRVMDGLIPTGIQLFWISLFQNSKKLRAILKRKKSRQRKVLGQNWTRLDEFDTEGSKESVLLLVSNLLYTIMFGWGLSCIAFAVEISIHFLILCRRLRITEVNDFVYES